MACQLTSSKKSSDPIWQYFTSKIYKVRLCTELLAYALHLSVIINDITLLNMRSRDLIFMGDS